MIAWSKGRRKKTYGLLRLGHICPTVSTLSRNIYRSRAFAKILRDLRPVVLHVQEVRGQRPLGGIGIVTLALFALAAAGLRLSTGAPGTMNQTMLVQRVGDPTVDDTKVELGRVTAQNGVGVVDVGARQIRDSRVQFRKADQDLLASIVLIEVLYDGCGSRVARAWMVSSSHINKT